MPFFSPPFPLLQISPFIHRLSFPEWEAINGAISEDGSLVEYQSIDDAIK